MNAWAGAPHPPYRPEDTVRSELVTGQGNSFSCNVQNAMKFNTVIINDAAFLFCSCVELHTMILIVI